MSSKKTRIVFALILLFFFISVVVSQSHWSTDPVKIQQRIKDLVTRLLCILYLMAPPIVLTMIAISAILIILHSENPDKRGAAKKLFKNAVYGGIMVLALVQIAKTLPEPARIVIDMSMCQTIGGGGGPGTSPGPSGYLVFPPDGSTMPMFLFMIPISYGWLFPKKNG